MKSSASMLVFGLAAVLLVNAGLCKAGDRPNILWIVSEDNNPYIGAYGDPVARTPTLDALARDGVLYTNCFSQAPVCAPSRFTLITGMYATSCGPAQHMRAQGRIPDFAIRGFPIYLRQAGYYCTNNSKTDYNAPVDVRATWDRSGKIGHWRNRAKGQPFFAVFNHEVTHESSIHGKLKPLPDGTDPAKVRLPAYSPDTPETRADKALYYDNMRRLDEQVAALLKQLEEDGLAEDTIVFYYGDNGGVLLRSKRFCYDSGLHVPLIVRFPKKFQHLAPAAPGSRIDAPVTFVDFAPTVLSLAGVKAPAHFQGKAFLGPQKAREAQYAFGFRNRMDERYDFVRTVRDQRYRYIRNYSPHLPNGQHVQYLWQQAGMRAWEALFKEGKLTEAQKRFWEPRPVEELYDLAADPDEVSNLAGLPEHAQTLQRLRDALRKHMLEIRDNGFIPEGAAAEGYEASRDDKAYPIERVMEVADLALRRDHSNLQRLVELLDDSNEIIRYWAAMGCLMMGKNASLAADALAKHADDPSPQVRVVVAEALCRVARAEQGMKMLIGLLKHENNRVRLQAANALDHLGARANPALAALETACNNGDDYVRRAAAYTAAILKGEAPPIERTK